MTDKLDHANAPRRFTIIQGPTSAHVAPPVRGGRWEIRPQGTGETYRRGKFTVHMSARVWIGASGKAKHQAKVEASYLCANCDTRFRSARPLPYCSLACKSQAKAVRAFRSAFATYGRALPEDVAQGPRIKMAHGLAGGYDSLARYLSRAASKHIIERDGGSCVLCSSPGTEIDTSTATAPTRATFGCCATPAMSG